MISVFKMYLSMYVCMYGVQAMEGCRMNGWLQLGKRTVHTYITYIHRMIVISSLHFATKFSSVVVIYSDVSLLCVGTEQHEVGGK